MRVVWTRRPSSCCEGEKEERGEFLGGLPVGCLRVYERMCGEPRSQLVPVSICAFVFVSCPSLLRVCRVSVGQGIVRRDREARLVQKKKNKWFLGLRKEVEKVQSGGEERERERKNTHKSERNAKKWGRNAKC